MTDLPPEPQRAPGPGSEIPASDRATPEPAAERHGPTCPAELEAVERRLAALSGERETMDPGELLFRLARLEEALGSVACELGDLGAQDGAHHPVIDVALAWEERLRAGGDEAAAAKVGAFAADRIVRDLRARERFALAILSEDPVIPTLDPAGQAPGLFDELARTEALRRRVEARAERIGPSVAEEAARVNDEALGVQGRLRSALELAVEAERPDVRLRGTWTDALLDLANETVLAASDARSRERAADMLGETAGAIRWHHDVVEKRVRGDASGARLRRRLKRRERRLRAARIEAQVEARLENRFGKRLVALWERSILVSLVVVLLLLLASFVRGNAGWIIALDTAICGVFLVDFLVKGTCARFHPLWLRRHVFTDLLPALPFGWLAGLEDPSDQATRYARLVRFLRGLQLAKYARALLPLIRLVRALSFLLRGLDRLVERNARQLETPLLLFPSPEERRRRALGAGEEAPVARYWRLRADLDGLYEAALGATEGEERARLLRTRLASLEEVGKRTARSLERDADTSAAARIDSTPAVEELLERLSGVRSEELEGRVGTEAIGRIARGARLVARTPLRLLPLLGGWAPPDAVDLPDRRVAARTVRRIARTFHRAHARVLWWADLKGAVTPGEVVGRFGSTLVARTTRPAVRLLLIAGGFVLVRILFMVAGLDWDLEKTDTDDWFEAVLYGAKRFVKIASFVLWVVGAVALVLLAVGVWLQRLARDSTTYLERVARAQFLHLTESVKARSRAVDAALVTERVFHLERALTEEDGALEASARDGARFDRHLVRFLSDGISPPSRTDTGFDPVARAVMLYRDFLDGALLTQSDTRATSQLLGNLAIQRAIDQSGRVRKRFSKGLRRLDLERKNTLVGGPYPWFHAITRALASRAARLIVEYNAHAVPWEELEHAHPAEREVYERWLRREAASEEEDPREAGEASELTTAFTVLHFLDDSEARDAEVAARFGDAVLARLRADRRDLFRTVFGSYPLHDLPHDARLVSARGLYQEWVGGGRVVLLPVRLALRGLRLSGKGATGLVRAVRAIRNPRSAQVVVESVRADFTAAARKLDRMRAPAALTALELRAILDPEYLGLALPLGLHDAEEHAERSRSPAQVDADFLRAPAELRDRLAALERRAARTIGDVTRLAREGLVERLEGQLGRPLADDAASKRALVALLVADADGCRSALMGPRVFGDAVADALKHGLPEVSLVPPLGHWLRFRRDWRTDDGARWIEAAQRAGLAVDGPAGRRRVRRAAWRVLWADVDGARAAFDAALDVELSEREGEERLAAALRHPARVSEQLVTLRIVQTLSLIDVRGYRRHVWALGQFAADGDRFDRLDVPDAPSSGADPGGAAPADVGEAGADPSGSDAARSA